MKIIHTLLVTLTLLCMSSAQAEDIFDIDTQHTFPSFEVDHMNLSTLRGNFTKTTGKIKMDKEALKGTVEIYIDPNSINAGDPILTEKVKGRNFLDVKKYPDIVYVGSMNFSVKSPTEINGQFTMRGVTKPLTLKINKFNCAVDEASNMYICGADASGQFDRADYGITIGKKEGVSTIVKLIVQVEATRVATDEDKSTTKAPN